MAEFADKEVCLISAEGEEFKVATKVAALSVMVQNIITEDDEDEKIVTLPNVSKGILAKVVEFGNHYVNEPMTEFVKPLQNADLSALVQPFYFNFATSLDQETLFHLTLAANYMDIRPLLDLCCARIASFIKDKSPEQIRTNLNIPNDFTAEEEAQVKAENKWAEDL